MESRGSGCPHFFMETFIISAVSDSDGNIRTQKMFVHDQSQCDGQVCVIHNPSDHHMRDWMMNWRADMKVMERLCPHGVGHSDPDGMMWLMRNGDRVSGVHGCDGCCREDKDAA